MIDHDEAVYLGLIARVMARLKPPRYRTLFYSADMDYYLDLDNPEEQPPATKTIREKLREFGVLEFVRLPDSVQLTNYVEVGHYPAGKS